MKHDIPLEVNRHIAALVEGRLSDPCVLLGPRLEGGRAHVRSFRPGATAVALVRKGGSQPLKLEHPAGLWLWEGGEMPRDYRLRYTFPGGEQEMADPYAFPPNISAHDLYLFNEGRLTEAWRTLGAQPMDVDGVTGTRFAVWAPNAERVSVVGDFNAWDGRVHLMRPRGGSGVWELFLPGVAPGALYKFEIRARDGGQLLVKSDPYARSAQLRPDNASLVTAESRHHWSDGDWMAARGARDWMSAPMNAYELHPGSWRRHPDGRMYSWTELADALIPWLTDLAYTHVELLPAAEHPLDESWGYQVTGYFAPTARHGGPDEFRAFVDALHRAGFGVILDWVPGHFPSDAFGLARFDGTALYEHEDPRRGLFPEWGTLAFNYGRTEVQSFLMSNARYWLSEFHLDGLRVDAVAAMLYLDYSRGPGQWLPNSHGGRENLEAIDFLRELNVMVHRDFPGALTIAEESTAWPMVSRPTWLGGLGFSMKWNMGWMHDSLDYMRLDPVYRRYHHDRLTFGQIYAYEENFVLPLSHDEVVHGKGSLLTRMPGDPWQQFANLRLLHAWQTVTPGKKLSFMGNEWGQGREWAVGEELEWWQLERPQHRGILNSVRDLNRLYRDVAALHQQDFSREGFRWIDCHDGDQSVVSFLRVARDGSCAAVLFNFTPVPREGYRIGLPRGGVWREAYNGDSGHYGGSDLGNGGRLQSEARPWMGYPASAALTLPPLAALILVPE